MFRECFDVRSKLLRRLLLQLQHEDVRGSTTSSARVPPPPPSVEVVVCYEAAIAAVLTHWTKHYFFFSFWFFCDVHASFFFGSSLFGSELYARNCMESYLFFLLQIFLKKLSVCWYFNSISKNPYYTFFWFQKNWKMEYEEIVIFFVSASLIFLLSCTSSYLVLCLTPCLLCFQISIKKGNCTLCGILAFFATESSVTFWPVFSRSWRRTSSSLANAVPKTCHLAQKT